MASAKRLTEILRVYLVSTRADVVDTDSLAFQLRNLKTNEVMKILTIIEETHGRSVLHIAAQFEHTGITQVIMTALPQQQRIELLTHWDCTPLHTAAMCGKQKASDELLCHLTTWQQIHVLSAFDGTGFQPAAQAARHKHPHHSAMLQHRLISLLYANEELLTLKQMQSDTEQKLKEANEKIEEMKPLISERDTEISILNQRLSSTEKKLDDTVNKFLEVQSLISASQIPGKKPQNGAGNVKMDTLSSNYSLGLNGDSNDGNSFAEPMSLKSHISTVGNVAGITGVLSAQPESTYENSRTNGQNSDASDSDDESTSSQVTLHLKTVSLSIDQSAINNDWPDIYRKYPDSPQTSSRCPPKPKPRTTTVPRAVSIEDNTYHGYSESIHKDYGSIGSSTLPKSFRQRDQQHTKPEPPSSVEPITRQGSDQPITDQY